MKSDLRTKKGTELDSPATTSKMNSRTPLLLSFCGLVAISCFQQIDTTASSGQPIAPPPPESDAGPSTVILPGAPPFGFSDDNGNIITSEDPCDATRAQANHILANDCAGCHGGRTPGERAGSPPFDFVLNVQKLTTTLTRNTTPPMLFVTPGDPEHSRVYMRVRHGEMPPPAEAQLPRPTTSDVSVLHEWIKNCTGATPPGGSTTTTTTASTTGGMGGSSGGDGGSTGAGGATGAGGNVTTGGGGSPGNDAGMGGGPGTDDGGASDAAACAAPYSRTNCGSYAVGTQVSRNGRNYTCADINCRNCSTDGRCAPGSTGCPAGNTWTNDGPCR
jgi:hypothetical protein